MGDATHGAAALIGKQDLRAEDALVEGTVQVVLGSFDQTSQLAVTLRVP